MVKFYQFRWCLWIIGILIASASLIRPETLSHFEILNFLVFSIFVICEIVACWLIHGFLIQQQFEGLNNTLKHIVSNVIAAFLATGIYYVFHYSFPANNLIDDRYVTAGLQNFIVHLSTSFFLSGITYVILNILYTNDALQKTVLENEHLKQAHLRAQLLSLQQQISPHFLFNSLSTLKTITQEPDAKSYIIQLAKVYRHLLNFKEYHLTTLDDELTFLKSYLYILNLRFEDSLFVDMAIDKQYLINNIPPLSLQLLVENAIKHNVISPDRPLHISIYTTDDPSIVIKNNLSPKPSENDGTGTGLQNINDRYRLLAQQQITVHTNHNMFSVSLPLL